MLPVLASLLLAATKSADTGAAAAAAASCAASVLTSVELLGPCDSSKSTRASNKTVGAKDMLKLCG